MLDAISNLGLVVDHWMPMIDSLVLLAETEPSTAGKLASSVASILKVVVGLGFVIFVHELGHFLAAKYFGVKCEKFYVGFDVPIKLGPIRLPATLGKFQWGETEYGIGMIPLGGYVKMLGQDDDPRRAAEEAERIRLQDPDSPNSAAKPKLDPRSFPAKPVYARMVIISAGVIMNLIFAVLMAAWAFRVGVPYEPTMIGGLSAGDPAWMAGLQPGDQIMQVGDMSAPNPKLHFMDMIEAVMMSGLKDESRIFPVVYERDGTRSTIELSATKKHDKDRFRAQIGVQIASTSRLSQKYPIFKTIDEIEGKVDVQGGDRIVGMEGASLPVDSRLDAIFQHEVMRRLNAKIDREVVLNIERTVDGKTNQVDVPLPAVSMRSLGLQLGIGAVTAVQPNSPAAAAGILVGDEIISFNGAPVVDGLTLHLSVVRQAGQSVTLGIKRAASNETIQVTWNVPHLPDVHGPPPSTVEPYGYEIVGAGLVYTVRPEVVGIDPGSESESQGLRIGDKITQVQVIASNDQERRDLKELFSDELFVAQQIGTSFDAVWMHQLVQYLPVGTKIKIHYERDKTMRDVTLKTMKHPEWHWFDRGLNFEKAKLFHRAETVGEAFSLGAKETWKRTKGVLSFLQLAVMGRMKMKAVGGPVMIFAQASSAASEGVPKLLMFLVMLSANLAILNFLPIPALDGGHMMFLLAEAVLGRPIDENWQMRLTMAGVLSLLALMAFVLINDTINLVKFFS